MKAGERNKMQLWQILRSVFGEEVVMEHRFHPTRRWRFDFAVPGRKLAVEYNGHGHTGRGHIGRHATITGMSGDCEKLNEAQRLGWTVLQFTALHFQAKDRAKHKLTAPIETIRAGVARATKPHDGMIDGA